MFCFEEITLLILQKMNFFPIYSYSLKYPVGFDLSIYLCQYHTIVTLSFNWLACISTVIILTVFGMYIYVLTFDNFVFNIEPRFINYQLLCRKRRFKTLFLILLFTPEKKICSNQLTFYILTIISRTTEPFQAKL